MPPKTRIALRYEIKALPRELGRYRENMAETEKIPQKSEDVL